MIATEEYKLVYKRKQRLIEDPKIYPPLILQYLVETTPEKQTRAKAIQSPNETLQQSNPTTSQSDASSRGRICNHCHFNCIFSS